MLNGDIRRKNGRQIVDRHVSEINSEFVTIDRKKVDVVDVIVLWQIYYDVLSSTIFDIHRSDPRSKKIGNIGYDRA